MNLRRYLFLFVFSVMYIFSVNAQLADTIAVEPSETGYEKKRERIIIQNANRQIIEIANDTLIQRLYGDVRAYHNGAFIFCDTAILKENDLLAYGDVVIIQDDTIKIFSDTLEYYGDISRAYLKHKVVLKSNETILFTPELEYFLDEKIAYYYQKGLIQDSVRTMKSQFGKYDLNNKYIDFDENVSIDSEDFMLRTQSLRFYTEEEVAVWNVPALIKNKDSWLYSETGFYDTKNKYSQFSGNAQFIDEESSAQAEIIRYDQESGQIEMYENVFYVSGTDIACGDTIFHNRKTEISQIFGNAYFESETQQAQGKKIFYDKLEDAMKISGGGTVQDSSITITALELDYNSKEKKGLAFGEVILHDTSANMTIWCDSLNYSGDEDYFKAINWEGKPVLAYELDDDILYISSDTLLSLREIRWFHPEDTSLVSGIDSLVAHNSSVKDPETEKPSSKESRHEAKSDKTFAGENKSIPPSPDTKASSREMAIAGAMPKDLDDQKISKTQMEEDPDVAVSENEISYIKTEDKEETEEDSISTSDKPDEMLPEKDSLPLASMSEKKDSINAMKNEELKLMDMQKDSMLAVGASLIGQIDSTAEITLDTLEGLIPDTIKYLIADKNVKIYRKGMQMISDSLSYQSRDSIFSFFYDPVIWSDSTQITGDTMHLFLRNKKLERMNVPSSPLIVKTGDEVFFDQITGKLLDADFLEGKLSKMKVQTDAKSVYYMLDSDKAYMGVNTTECKFMIYEFEDGEITDIRNYTDISNTIHPMEDTNHEQLKLSGFAWKIDQKPKLKEVLNKYYELIVPEEPTPEPDSKSTGAESEEGLQGESEVKNDEENNLQEEKPKQLEFGEELGKVISEKKANLKSESVSKD